MTTTYSDPQVPEATRPAAPASFTRRHRKSLIVTGVLAAALAAGVTTGALAGGSHPATAAAMVTADGYTLAYNMTPTQITADFGQAAPFITSAAIGTDVQGNAEADIYFTPAGINAMNAAASLKSETLSQYLEADIPGSAVTVSGGVIRVDAPESVVVGAGGLGTP